MVGLTGFSCKKMCGAFFEPQKNVWSYKRAGRMAGFYCNKREHAKFLSLRMATGSDLYFYLPCFHATTLTLLGVFPQVEAIKIWEKKCSLPVFVPGSKTSLVLSSLTDGAYYCYCAYVLRIPRYSDFLSPMLTNTGIFLRSLKLSGESRS